MLLVCVRTQGSGPSRTFRYWNNLEMGGQPIYLPTSGKRFVAAFDWATDVVVMDGNQYQYLALRGVSSTKEFVRFRIEE